MSDQSNTYLSGANAAFIEELYAQYLKDPASIDPSWQVYFKALAENPAEVQRSIEGASWQPYKNKVIGVVSKEERDAQKTKSANTNSVSKEEIELSLKVAGLLSAYRAYGHMGVNLDPLGLNPPSYHAELDHKSHGLADEDLDKEVFLPEGFGSGKAKIRDFIAYLRATYSGRVGAEFMHIESAEERAWLQERIEASASKVSSLAKDERLSVLTDMIHAEMFENYLHTKFPGTKRFSIEGLESMIPAIKVIVKSSVISGVREFIFGMAHRGRLTTLTNVMGKSFHAMFAEFQGGFAFPEGIDIPGDVKYHLGASTDLKINGQDVHMSLTPNPSHLEVVNPVVLGKVRAKQDMRQDKSRSEVLGILIHGDAAFAGQGTVMESLALSQLKVYHTGGTMHIVANNQIGFTTKPGDSRSTNYSTDIAKFIGAAIFHVNGDDADAVAYVSQLAAEYRSTFKKDVVVDIIGYRKYGHNEGDEPFFTQPIMYSAIKGKKTPDVVYEERLIAEGVFTKQEVDKIRVDFKAMLDAEYQKSIGYRPNKADWLEHCWSKMEMADINRKEALTGCDLKLLKSLGEKIATTPADFNVNPKIAKQLEAKKQMMESAKDLDWSMGEALAFGTLLNEGYNVRITGQDAKRGTFSHRHAVLFDQKTEQEYTPLNNIDPAQKGFLEIANSNLSEFGVLGFEYGYSFTDPNTLTIWEAQFGDFANGAQVMIDQYIASGEAKWLRMNGLVMLLPHGFEGQGPEHSSARLERFLQLCARDNMQVVNCTTPASIYHALRRQMHRNFRKPLIVMSPKSLLRHKLAVSDLKDFSEGTSFQLVIAESKKLDNVKVKKVILCSGKVYYDLYEKREELKRDDIAIIRLEQLYPFPKKSLAIELAKYPNAQIVWCQEEHENMGAFYFVEPRLERVLKTIEHKCTRPSYIGRRRAPSPAVGYMKLHIAELAAIMEEVFG